MYFFLYLVIVKFETSSQGKISFWEELIDQWPVVNFFPSFFSEITETLKSLENPPDHQTVIQVPHIQVPAQAGQNNQKSSQMHDSSPLTPSPSRYDLKFLF